MTFDEAIIYIQKQKDFWADIDKDKESSIVESLDMAITALHAQQEAEKNKPLTLDDLKEMDGQPVWAEEPDGYKHYSRWCLVDCAWKSKGLIYLRSSPGQVALETFITNGGKIYRHPPKEAHDGADT